MSEGTRTGMPGRLMPLFSPSMPPLMISQTTSDADHLVHAQFDEAIGQQNARSLFDVFRECLECGADQRCSAGNLSRCNREALPSLEQHRLMILEFRRSYLWSLQVAQDAQRLVFFAADLADHLDECQLFLVGAMRKVEANNVDAGANQFAKYGLGIGRRTESRNNFRTALNWGIGQAGFNKWHRNYSKKDSSWEVCFLSVRPASLYTGR